MWNPEPCDQCGATAMCEHYAATEGDWPDGWLTADDARAWRGK